ncbi:glycosyltransferase family 39 protein [Bacillus massilinigeriensis]|uniref:glycosyltransferase family 39 protein n=1 Tax=Bacillus mediterraneensis TaxID=1805474 RepID=UPI0008F899C9|nr:glycosyltransferase family 39 protein [Bacillus mediterraneensis]
MSRNLDGKEHWKSILMEGLGVSVFLCLLVFQFMHINPYAPGWDQVDYSLALERYDISKMQPHFPGYPYYILGGKAVAAFFGSTPEALAFFNILLYGSSLLPLYFISRRYLKRHLAVLTAVAVYSSAYSLVVANSPMSEGAAMAIFWWYFFSLVIALEKKQWWYSLLPAFTLGLLLGIRLSYLPFGIGQAFLILLKWKRKELDMRKSAVIVLATVLFQLLWIFGAAASEGGIKAFLSLAWGFTNGHFQEWGGTAAGDDLPFYKRLSIFLFDNVVWWGIAARSWFILGFYLTALSFVLLSFRKVGKFFLNDTGILSLILLTSYGIWSFTAQNIEKPRHIIPIAAILVFLLAINLLKNQMQQHVILLVVCLILSQSVAAVSLIKQQSAEIPAVYALSHYIEKMEEPLIVYTWEETRVMEYLDMPYLHKRVYTYDVFLQDSAYYSTKEIYLTDSVVEGFRQQGIDLSGKVEKVAQFDSNSLFDPVYHSIILYKWKKEERAAE